MSEQTQPAMPENVKKSIHAATKFALDKNGGRTGGWAMAQQRDAILFLVAEENGGDVEEYRKANNVLNQALTRFLNASATAQALESAGVIDKRQGRQKGANPFAGFGAWL